MYYSKVNVQKHLKLLLASVAAQLSTSPENAKGLISLMTPSDENRGRHLLLDTKAGVMRFGIVRGHSQVRKHTLAWVYCQFEDVAAAKALLPHSMYGPAGDRLNPYSGKWNYMFCSDGDWEVEGFVSSLRTIGATNLRPKE